MSEERQVGLHITIYTFRDTSEKAHAAVTFARQKYENQYRTVSTQYSKVKVCITKGHEYSTVSINGSIDRFQINIADKQSIRNYHE